jgi:2,3-bisphosphoglycerate-independent phosphoglycerate mutase
MIIAAIDSLKGRKARPDELKICNFVERRFGLKKEDIIKAINSAVSEGSVLKVKYKDSVSYRNPLKLSHKMQNHIISIDGNSTQQTMKRVLRELRVLSRSTPNGVSAQTICDSLKNTSNYDFDLIEKVLKRAIETGIVLIKCALMKFSSLMSL